MQDTRGWGRLSLVAAAVLVAGGFVGEAFFQFWLATVRYGSGTSFTGTGQLIQFVSALSSICAGAVMAGIGLALVSIAITMGALSTSGPGPDGAEAPGEPSVRSSPSPTQARR